MALNTPSGTRGARYTGSNGRFTKWFARQMETRIRRRGFRMMGMDILFLTTTGRRTGQSRQVPVAWFPDGADAWLVANPSFAHLGVTFEFAAVRPNGIERVSDLLY